MPTKLRRHAPVDMICRQCGTEYQAPKSRVDAGQGTFCTHKCYTLWYKENESYKVRGFEKGKKYWDKRAHRWFVRWIDEEGTQHNVGYARWWWKINVGNIEEGYSISYIDGDQSNIDPSNFECIPEKMSSAKASKFLVGISRPDISGENCKWWKGGKPKEYPPEFSKRIKRKIKTRDNYTCQSCLCVFDSTSLDVHHKDRDKYNNEDDNLITLCKSCHKAVHGKENKTNAAIEELKQLLNFPEGE